MDKLIESNLTVFNALALKYNTLKLLKKHKLTPTDFSVNPLLQDDLSDALNLTHYLLELYVNFKDILTEKEMPSTPRISTDIGYLVDVLDDYNLPEKIHQALEFDIIEIYKAIYYDDFEEQKLLKKLFSDFTEDNYFDEDFFEIHEHINLNQTVITHSLIDDLFSEKDTIKTENLLDFLNSEKNISNIANFFLPLASNACYDTFVSITTIEKLKDSPFLKGQTLPNFKYAIVFNSVQVPDWHNDHDILDYIETFLEFYKLLLKE